MNTQKILDKYLDFYGSKGHVQIPNVSMVPENDSTLLFVNSGMFPLVPYLSGEKHPMGKRLMNVQRCIRFEDLDDIGDHIHTLAFHMIGNWSLGDYFKKDQLYWKYEFFIEHLGLDINRIYGSVFAGDEDAPKDTESVSILKEVFNKYGIEAKEGERIWLYGKKHNWWQRGEAVGELGGPCSEIFYYLGSGDPKGLSPADTDTEFVEIGNSVFMEYRRTEKGWEKLAQSNVDYGGGLERIATAVQKKRDIYETDNFWPIIEKIEDLSLKKYRENEKTTYSMRNLADHIRGSVFLAMDGVVPGNKDQGYILRRLLRRMVRFARALDIKKDISANLVPVVSEMFQWLYPDLKNKQGDIQKIFIEEEKKFYNTLGNAHKHVKKVIDGSHNKKIDYFVDSAFNLYQSLGYPFEIFFDDLADSGIHFKRKEFDELFNKKFQEHQEISRKGAENKFKGGLADHSEQTVKYHTATHLLHHALRKVLGDSVIQHGSNITGDRLRFDYNNNNKLTDEQVLKVESLINDLVNKSLPVNYVVLPKEQAEKTGAIHAFGEKYTDKVKVYFIGDSLENAVSKEYCGGPHVKNTSEIGEIKIYRQETIGKGVQRIYCKNKE